MAKFKFKMEFLLRLRRQREEEAMSRLSKRLASIRDIEGRLEDIKQRREELAQALTEKTKAGGLTAPLFILYKEYQARLTGDVRKATELLRLSRKEEAKERALLTQAVIDRKVIERLREKKADEFKAHTQYQEQNNLEELAALAKATRDRHEFDDNAGVLP